MALMIGLAHACLALVCTLGMHSNCVWCGAFFHRILETLAPWFKVLDSIWNVLEY